MSSVSDCISSALENNTSPLLCPGGTSSNASRIDEPGGKLDLSSLRFVMEWSISLTIVLLNSTVFIIIPRMATLRKTTRNGILSLAVADLLTGCVLIMGLSYTFISRSLMATGSVICNIFAYLNNTTCFTSIYTVTFMNLDKYLTLKFPFSYNRRMTTGKAKIFFISFWVLWLTIFAPLIPGTFGPRFAYNHHTMLCCIDWLSPNEFIHMMVVQFLGSVVPSTVNIIAFVGIMNIALRRHDPSELQAQKSDGGPKDKKITKELKVVRTLFIMTVGIYIAWLPYISVVGFYNYFTQQRIHFLADFISAWIAMSNSFWNVFVYLFTMRPYQKAFLNLMPCTRHLAEGSSSSSAATASSSVETTSKGATEARKE